MTTNGRAQPPDPANGPEGPSDGFAGGRVERLEKAREELLREVRLLRTQQRQLRDDLREKSFQLEQSEYTRAELAARVKDLKSHLSYKLTAPARELRRALRRGLRLIGRESPSPPRTGDRIAQRGSEGQPQRYKDWVARWDTLRQEHVRGMQRRLEAMRRPRIAVLMPVYNPPAQLLEEAIASVAAQIYPDWELCIADDASTEPHVRRVLEAWAGQEPRIRIVFRDRNGHISAASNSALELVTANFVALMDHDDVLRPHALFRVAEALDETPELDLLYSDEDKIDGAPAALPEAGDAEPRRRRFDPHFKPDWNPDLFLSQNYLNHLTVLRTDLVRQVGGFRPGFEGSQDYDLYLRVVENSHASRIRHLPHVLYHWRAVEGSTALATGEKSYAWTAGKRALEEHFSRLRRNVRVSESRGGPFYRCLHPLPDEPPLVSVVIPSKDRLDLLAACVESIREKTTYPAYEILIVDNGSVEPRTREYLSALSASDRRVRVLPYPHLFNYSAINNFAAAEARGSLLALLNNDIVVITPEWLDEMVSHAVRPEIGAVGAKLYYPDDTIQHAGVILGLGGIAGHAQRHVPRGDLGYFGRNGVAWNMSAVTAACLVIRKEVFDLVGGFDERELKVAFNDVDLCLKVREAGYRNLWTPFAELYHHESTSRGLDDTPEKEARFRSEVAVMRHRWRHQLQSDPAYSPNLSLRNKDFSLAAVPRLALLEEFEG